MRATGLNTSAYKIKVEYAWHNSDLLVYSNIINYCKERDPPILASITRIWYSHFFVRHCDSTCICQISFIIAFTMPYHTVTANTDDVESDGVVDSGSHFAEDSESDSEAGDYADEWVPQPSDGIDFPLDNNPEPSSPPVHHNKLSGRAELQAHLREPFTIEPFPLATAGKPVGRMQERFQSYKEETSNIHAPFNSKCDWEMAEWAMRRRPGSNAFSELLRIDGVSSVLKLISPI